MLLQHGFSIWYDHIHIAQDTADDNVFWQGQLLQLFVYYRTLSGQQQLAQHDIFLLYRQ